MTHDHHTPAIAGGSPIRDELLPFTRPCLSDDTIEEVVSTLRSGWLATGPKTAQFETEFASYIGNQNAIGTTSGTSALGLALEVAGIATSDEVITTPLTFVATAHQILLRGATPVFVDIDPATYNIDPALIEASIGPKTKAILLVHFAGRSCEMAPILALAKKHGLTLIHDSAHAIETLYHGQRLAELADISAFSFHPNKNLTTGEGGMVTTDREDWANTLRSLRFHGIQKTKDGTDVLQLAGKCNMSDIQGTIGLCELSQIDDRWEKRNQLFARYDSAFSKLEGIAIPAPRNDEHRHAMHMYNPLIETDQLAITRNSFVEAMKAENIAVGIHYSSLHETTFYRERFGFKKNDFAQSSYVSDRIVTLPLHPSMSSSDAQDVIAATQRILSFYRK